MSKKEKLYARIKNNQKNVRFQDFCTLMEHFGFALVRISGSHHLYQRPEFEAVMNVQPKKDKLAKAYQVQQFLKLVDAHNLQLENEPEDKADEQ